MDTTTPNIARMYDYFLDGKDWITDWRPSPFENVRGVAETLRGGVGRKAA